MRMLCCVWLDLAYCDTRMSAVPGTSPLPPATGACTGMRVVPTAGEAMRGDRPPPLSPVVPIDPIVEDPPVTLLVGTNPTIGLPLELRNLEVEPPRAAPRARSVDGCRSRTWSYCRRRSTEVTLVLATTVLGMGFPT